VPANTLRRHYKECSSGFRDWDQKSHAENYMLFPDNIGEHLSIDELAISQGELYTFVTNKQGKGKRGSLVASIKGTLSRDIIAVLKKLPLEKRKMVKEVTLDMANNMESAARKSFPEAKLVTDRFHVVKLAIAAIQHLRIKQRWKELDKDNEAIEKARKDGKKYKPMKLSNGDTPKQLLARCRYILAKNPDKWTENQKLRAEILFELYPDIHEAYKHVFEFKAIYKLASRELAEPKLKKWIENTYELDIKEFNTVANTITNNYENILNFFINRNTNANAESFNSKIKLFRANLRGVSDHAFFLFRLQNLFA
jgi:transposase